jgi:multiple sugar transport system ATP-binding protein
MVFQSRALYPHMTVAQNISSRPRACARVVAERIEPPCGRRGCRAELDQPLGRRPSSLGRPAAARGDGRAMVRNPWLFLFDEPL